MTHRLSEPNNPQNAIGRNPMTAVLRYRCQCGNQELLNIQSVFSASTDEQMFIETMRMLWRDMQTEIRQHLKEQP